MDLGGRGWGRNATGNAFENFIVNIRSSEVAEKIKFHALNECCCIYFSTLWFPMEKEGGVIKIEREALLLVLLGAKR